MNGYLVCMIIGLVIPVFSLVADFSEGCADLISVDLDFPESSIYRTVPKSISLIPPL